MKKLTHLSLTMLLVSLCFPASADDTELYVSDVSITNNGRPKVLIIFDNSGSMDTDVPGTRPAYSPGTTYTTQGSVSSSRLYWSTTGKPPSTGTDQWIQIDSNRCASSTSSLDAQGMYTDRMRVWRSRKGNLSWRQLAGSSGTQDSDYVDCRTDVTDENDGNPGTPAQGAGYPTTSSGPYTAAVTDSNISWDSDDTVTLYTANYMNWYHDSSLAAPTRTRLEIAQEVVTGIIESNPSVDFGLMVFNDNNSTPNGGRVVHKINENMTDAQRTAVIDTINSLAATTYTPLCETLYEAYRYYAGLSVLYGDDQTSPDPARDTTAESSGTYISPMGDCQQAYVIYMTDGAPTNDTAANTAIDALPGIGSTSDNRLDELAGWLYNRDLDGDDSNGTQRVVTYTIGFQTDQTLLSNTAEAGGGLYYTADDAADLTDAFQGAINEILETDTTFTAPAVAVNSFNRSRSLDDVYIAMFRPTSKPRWSGNLKKLSITSDGTLVDTNNVAAIDPLTGNIKDTATTVWSTSVDGASVENGGAGALLAARNPSTRTIKTNTGTDGALENFVTTNTNITAAAFGAADDTEKDQLINWARGVDVDDDDDDESTTDNRPWILGDPLHSRPLVINYGARGTYTRANPDTRIVMGTNAGVFHMFSGDDGQEDWAFIPTEMYPVVKTIRDNTNGDDHPYGIDGVPVSYTYDHNNDGTISGASDKVYVFFGLRRGGSALYAMNVTDPDSPTFMWRIDAATTGFSELGQSWSTPIVTTIPGHTGPVLIFAAGYDTNKDVHEVGDDDTEGRGIFIVNAVTGALIWSVTPAADSTTNMQETALVDSMPAPVGILDSNGDGLTDRVYAADTGGNIWRVDMPGNTLPNASQNTWSIFKLASLGGATASTDRRFFNQPDVVSTRYNNVSFDAVAIGSGNRSHPNETDVVNRFYMLKDTAIATSYHGSGPNDTPIPSAITEADLYDATSNAIQDGTAAEQSAAVATLNSADGWYITLEGSGEKSLSSSLTIGGVLYFTTFAPDADASSCVPVPGVGYLYAVSFHQATSQYEWNGTTGKSKGDRAIDVGARLPDSVTPHFGEDAIRIIGVGGGDDGKGSYDTGAQLTTSGTYWYRQSN